VLDSNDVLAGITGGRAYTLAFETWHVVVPATTESIDTHRDQTRADHTNASQLFAPDPVPGVVLGYSVEPEVRALVPTSVREDAQ
jgi:hypothetical protein